MNTARYAAKHVIQKILANVGLVRLQEFVKQITGHWDEQLTEETLDRRIAHKLRVFHELDLAPSGYVVEQGTGWYGLDPILFYLSGSDRVDTFDTTHWLRKELFLKSVRACLRNAAEIKKGIGRTTVDIDKRIDSLRELTKVAERSRLADLLQRVNTNYQCTRTAGRSGIRSDSVDLFYTDSVLQRIAPPELETLVRESHRILRRGGKSYHVVDCKDFHAIGNPSVPECWYLTISPAFYSLISSKYVNYQNRLRMPEFVELFARSSYAHVDVVQKIVKPENVQFCIENRDRIPASVRFDADEIAVSQFTLLAQK